MLSILFYCFFSVLDNFEESRLAFHSKSLDLVWLFSLSLLLGYTLWGRMIYYPDVASSCVIAGGNTMSLCPFVDGKFDCVVQVVSAKSLHFSFHD